MKRLRATALLLLTLATLLPSCSRVTRAEALTVAAWLIEFGGAALLPPEGGIVSRDEANAILVKAQMVRRLARDTVASAHVAGLSWADDAAVSEFDQWDQRFTRSYTRLRTLADSGDLARFSLEYVLLREAADRLRQIAARGDS